MVLIPTTPRYSIWRVRSAGVVATDNLVDMRPLHYEAIRRAAPATTA